MKFFLMFFDKIIYRPSYKFYLNLFILKNTFYFNFKNLIYIHFFTNLKNNFNINFIKINYVFYKNFIFYFILINLVVQCFIVLIFI